MFNIGNNNDKIEGNTNGLFSISPTQKMFFAKGNL